MTAMNKPTSNPKTNVFLDFGISVTGYVLNSYFNVFCYDLLNVLANLLVNLLSLTYILN